jgi:hypothetical protein
MSEIRGPLGAIDFANQRCLVSQGDEEEWILLAPGCEYFGAPGDWEEEARDDDTLGDAEPFWLLELLAAAVEATREGEESVLGAHCERYSVISSFALATRQSQRPIAPPSGALDLERLATDVWLDDEGLIRRAFFHGDHTLMMLEMGDFGSPDPIELPGPDELTPEE